MKYHIRKFENNLYKFLRTANSTPNNRNSTRWSLLLVRV